MIYVVSGFFRSGTSMMMQALEAGGIPVYYAQTRDNRINKESPALGRRPNPVSLYEPSMKDMENTDFPRMHDGKAVKLLIPWLGSLAVHKKHYKVVMMKRDPYEIMSSYEAAFGEFWDGFTRQKWIDEYEDRFSAAEEWFRNRKDVDGVSVMEFVELRENTANCLFSLVSAGWPLDFKAANRVVEPELAWL